MLVEFKKPMSMFHRLGLKYELEDALGKKVDLLTYNAINQLLKEYIYKDEIKIYGEKP
ncbi:MAG: polymerase beta domain protein region protein [Candidatus Falkowbacteria bacterium GW2011_GWA2_41_14]|uniref:Polymerase beta domain protein region protein n=1 Tax=Candidatus Falkowbacteria bacterium GW2011_GWA2_41_14 TaxID=1618635 RepID=A0A0G0X3J8_9BACT|nr:MAG: polymerase beta domain protein region protein [Candidatus Falkowbacteria bacterium GW2011_GWA2_41_14]